MSRSGYSDDCESNTFGLWRGAVASSIRGKRGQKLIKELVQAMDEMPVKELIAEELKAADGSFCALGVIGAKRGIDMDSIDPEDYDVVAKAFDIPAPLVQEIVYENDEICRGTPAERWSKMRKWLGSLIKENSLEDGL